MANDNDGKVKSKTWRICAIIILVLIGVGGIFSGADADDKIAAGAQLVQVYSGLIYKGPNLVAECA